VRRDGYSNVINSFLFAHRDSHDALIGIIGTWFCFGGVLAKNAKILNQMVTAWVNPLVQEFRCIKVRLP